MFWKPVYNILEANFELLLVNPHHIKAVPGRKTDVNDADAIYEASDAGVTVQLRLPSDVRAGVPTTVTARATVNGIETYYEIHGREGAPWLVFSHSLACSVRMWDGEIERQKDRYRVLVDRGLGLLGLVLLAAIGATLGRSMGDDGTLGARRGSLNVDDEGTPTACTTPRQCAPFLPDQRPSPA